MSKRKPAGKTKKTTASSRSLTREEKELKAFLKEFGRVIEKYRLMSDRTQAAMEEEGIDLRSWGRFVAGGRDFRVSSLLKICRALKRQPGKILSDISIDI